MSDQEKKMSASIPQNEREAINYGRGGFYAPEGTAENLAKMQNAVADAYHRSYPITIDLTPVLAAGSPNSLCPEVQEDFKSTAEPSDMAAKINAMANGTRTVNLMDGENWANFREAVEKQGTFPLPEVFFPTVNLAPEPEAIRANAEESVRRIGPLVEISSINPPGYAPEPTEWVNNVPYERRLVDVRVMPANPNVRESFLKGIDLSATAPEVEVLVEQGSVRDYFKEWTVQIETHGVPEVGEGVKEMAQQILNQTGMSAKELIANSSVNDNHPLVFGDMTPRPVEVLPVMNSDATTVPEPVEAKVDDAIPEENLRYTSVPIPTELIREYFTNKGIFYVVDYQKSRLKGSNFLTYLTNLAVPSDVNFGEALQYEEYSEVMKAYLDQRSVISCSLLHVMAAELLLYAKGLVYERSPYMTPVPDVSYLERFIDENKEQIGRWLHFLDSTQVFALSAIKRLNEHYRPKETFEVIDDKDYVGANIAQLYRIPEFIAYYFAIEGAEYKLSYFVHQYEEYMFKNERLAKYFRSPNNFAALMFEHIAVGTFKASDIGYGLFGIGVFDPAKGIPEYDQPAPASED